MAVKLLPLLYKDTVHNLQFPTKMNWIRSISNEKKTKVINSDISRVIAQMGHFDKLSIGDTGMPVPRGTEKIDLAVDSGIPSFMDVLNNVLEELEIQKIYLAEEIKEKTQKF